MSELYDLSFYQSVVESLGFFVLASTPIVIMIGLAGKLVNGFLSMVMGKERVNL